MEMKRVMFTGSPREGNEGGAWDVTRNGTAVKRAGVPPSGSLRADRDADQQPRGPAGTHLEAQGPASRRCVLEVVGLPDAHELPRRPGSFGEGEIEPVLRQRPPAYDHRVVGDRGSGVRPGGEREDGIETGRREIEQPQPGGAPRVQHHCVGIPLPVDLGRVRAGETVPLIEEDVIVGRRWRTGIANDERTFEPADLLPRLVYVRV